MQRFRLVATAFLCALCDATYATPEQLPPSQANKPKTQMVVSYNKIPSLSNAYAYRYQLIQQILEVTRPEYGDYQLNSYEMEITSQRQAEFLGRGKILNLAWGSPGSTIADANAIPIPVDILNGLLGYRICLINKEAPLDIDKISDVASLNQIKIGQGLWIDVDFYKFNHLHPIAVPSFDNLFSMLSAKRIDCLALGINEVESLYQDKKKMFPAIAIDKKLLIYYYFPTYLYVSKNTPELAKRIESGLIKMKKSGAFDELFMRHHEKNLAHLDLHQRKLICLKSPYLTSANACSGPLTFNKNTPAANPH